MKTLVELFSSEIGRNLAPLLCLPLYDGDGDAVCLEPRFGTLDELKEFFGLFSTIKQGLARLLAHPTDSRAAIAVDNHLEPLLVEHGQGVDDGEKLANIIGAVYGAEVKYLLAVAEVYTTVLHRARVAATRGIYGKGIALHYGGQCVEGKGRRVGLLLHIGMSWRSVRAFCFFARVERLVRCSFDAFYLRLAVVPTMVNTRVETTPNDVELFLLAHGFKGV